MLKVHNPDGDEIADDVPISPRQLGALNAGGEISVLFHVPQLLRGMLDMRPGAFSLRKIDDRYVTQEPAMVKVYADLQRRVQSAMKERNG